MNDGRRLDRQRQDTARGIDRRYLVTGQPHPRIVVRTKDGGRYPTERWKVHVCDAVHVTFEERENAPLLVTDAGYEVHVGNLSRNVPPVGKLTIAHQDVGRWWMLPAVEFPCLLPYRRTAQRAYPSSEDPDNEIRLPWFSTCGTSSSTDEVLLCEGCDVPPCCRDACSGCPSGGYAPHTWRVVFGSECVISEPPTVLRCVDLTRKPWLVTWEDDCLWSLQADATNHQPAITIRIDPVSGCIEMEVTHGTHHMCYSAPLPDGGCCSGVTLYQDHPDCGCDAANDCPCADEITITPSDRGVGCDVIP